MGESWLALSGQIETIEKAGDQMLAVGGSFEAAWSAHTPQKVGKAF